MVWAWALFFQPAITMTWSPIEILTASRLPDLYRLVCERAGLPTAGPAAQDRFVVRCGPEPPALLAKLLEEVLPDAAPQVDVFHLADDFDLEGLAPGQVVVREGYALPAPIPQELWQSVRGGRVLVFAVERYGPQNQLVSVVWAAVSEEPARGEEPLRAAVAHEVLEARHGDAVDKAERHH
jgi:hypothetical protein